MKRFTREKKKSSGRARSRPCTQQYNFLAKTREVGENHPPGNILSEVVDDGEGETRPRRRIKDR